MTIQEAGRVDAGGLPPDGDHFLLALGYERRLSNPKRWPNFCGPVVGLNIKRPSSYVQALVAFVGYSLSAGDHRAEAAGVAVVNPRDAAVLLFDYSVDLIEMPTILQR